MAVEQFAIKTMITITPITTLHLHPYFRNCPKDAVIPNSVWKGEASKFLQLEGEVKWMPILAMFNGFTPNGKVSLLTDQAREAGPEGWLMRFTAPASIRNLWAMAPERDRIEIADSHEFGAHYCLHSFERSLRGPENGRPETRIPGVAIAVVPHDPLKQEVPTLQTDGLMANLHLPVHGTPKRCPIIVEELPKKAKALNELYTSKVCERLHRTLGIEFLREAGREEPKIVGVPETLDFSLEPSRTGGNALSRLLHSPESLKFMDWQASVGGQGWSTRDAASLLKFFRETKSVWSTLEEGKREKMEKLQAQSDQPEKVTKTLFKTTTQTHCY